MTELLNIEALPSLAAARVDAPLEPLRALFAELARKYATRPRDRSDHAGDDALLCEACVRHAALSRDGAVHVVVVGPTQVGKSTVVNLLSESSAAEVSPLAGFTMHATGFALGRLEPYPPTGGWFPGFARVEPAALEAAPPEAYATQACAIDGMLAAIGDPTVIWDTPDFDSITAGRYRQAVLESIALADVILVVLSKEKYADLSVWQMMQRLALLERSLLVCVNKMTPDAEPIINRALQERLAEVVPKDKEWPIVTLPLSTAPAEDPAFADATVRLRQQVRAAFLETKGKARLRLRRRGTIRLAEDRWSSLTAPVEAEHAAVQAWETLIAESLAAFVAAYRRDYLDHPQRYDSFRKATAELLDLMELPGISRPLATVRQYVTLPVRFALRVGREWVGGSAASAAHVGEDALLRAGVDDLLAGIRRDVSLRADQDETGNMVWRVLSIRLGQEEPLLRERFQAAVEDHCREVAREIRETADALFAALRERPAVLNTLRATRATADAAGIALAIKTGGAHLNDLLFAPAMLAVTSLLTESALGGYMNRLRAQLKQRQLENVQTALIDTVFAVELSRLTEGLDERPELFGVSADELANARDALQRWKQIDD